MLLAIVSRNSFKAMRYLFRSTKPLFWTALLLLSVSDWMYAERFDEAAVKVAFIYNFIKFIEWPDNIDRQNDFKVCTLKADALQGRLSVLQGKMRNRIPIDVRYGVSVDALKTCQVVFISDSTNIDWIVEELRNRPIVTVSDQPEFIQKGGGLALIKEGNRISFEVNLDATSAAGLHVSAQLLKLARRIQSGP